MKKQELHEKLCLLILKVEQDQDIGPFIRFIDSLTASARTKSQIVTWVQSYTPFVFRLDTNGQYHAKKSRKGQAFSSKAAKDHPFWKFHEFDKSSPDAALTPACVPSLSQIAQRELSHHSQRAITDAVKVFFRSPNELTFADVIDQLNQYKDYGATSQGIERNFKSQNKRSYVHIVQGGLPSLGKRAK